MAVGIVSVRPTGKCPDTFRTINLVLRLEGRYEWFSCFTGFIDGVPCHTVWHSSWTNQAFKALRLISIAFKQNDSTKPILDTDLVLVLDISLP